MKLLFSPLKVVKLLRLLRQDNLRRPFLFQNYSWRTPHAVQNFLLWLQIVSAT